jgi:hypothetical protein
MVARNEMNRLWDFFILREVIHNYSIGISHRHLTFNMSKLVTRQDL